MAFKTVGGALGFYSSTQCVYPVWKNSTRDEVRFVPMLKRQAVKLFHDARRFERRTRIKGRQDGRIGRNGLALLQAMLFDCIDYASGKLDPCYATLARHANISVRSVHRGLVKLAAAGVLKWIRRCHWNADGTLEQDTNAYSVQTVDQWQGYTPPAPTAPAPLSGTWGDHPKTKDPIDLARDAAAAGNRREWLAALDYDADPNSLAATIARTMRARSDRETGGRS